MEDKNKDMTPEQVPEKAQEDARELSDEQVENVAGGTIPIIRPF